MTQLEIEFVLQKLTANRESDEGSDDVVIEVTQPLYASTLQELLDAAYKSAGYQLVQVLPETVLPHTVHRAVLLFRRMENY